MNQEASELLRRLQPIVPMLWEALETGVEVARDHFERSGARRDPYLAAHLTRFHTRWALERSLPGVDFEVDENIPSIPNLPNSGIRVRLAGVELWILKTFQGGVPAPGRSRRRQEAWQQPMFELKPARTLLVLWDVDDNYELAVVSLVRPKKGDADPTSGEALWEVALPRPSALTLLGENVVREVVTLDDLDTIRLPKQAETSTNAAADDLR